MKDVNTTVDYTATERRPVFKMLPTLQKRAAYNLSDLYGQAGCYLIYENGKIVYCGSSRNLGKRIQRNFQRWDGREYNYSERINKNEYSFIALKTKRLRDARKLECEIMGQLRPRDNDEKDACLITEEKLQALINEGEAELLLDDPRTPFEQELDEIQRNGLSFEIAPPDDNPEDEEVPF